MSYEEIKNKEVKKTRKPHQCEWCAETIESGSTARHRTYVFDGDFNSAYMHPECVEAMHEMPNDILMDGWMAGDYARGSTGPG